MRGVDIETCAYIHYKIPFSDEDVMMIFDKLHHVLR